MQHFQTQKMGLTCGAESWKVVDPPGSDSQERHLPAWTVAGGSLRMKVRQQMKPTFVGRRCRPSTAAFDGELSMKIRDLELLLRASGGDAGKVAYHHIFT